MPTATDTTTAAAFTVGQNAEAGHGSDYRWTFEVTRRTAKFVTLRDLLSGDVHRVKIHIDVRTGDEWALPFGSYSMAAVARPVAR